MKDFYAILRELVEFTGDADALVLSLYLDVSVDGRSGAYSYAKRELSRHRGGEGLRSHGFSAVIEALLQGLEEQIERACAEGYTGLAVFECAEPALSRELRLRFPFQNQCQVGRDPYLRQLLFYAEEYEQSVCAIVADDEVSLCEVHVGDVTRATRVVAGAERSAAEEAAVQLSRLVQESPGLHVILAGAERPRLALEAQLSGEVMQRIIGRLQGPCDPRDPRFLAAVHRVLQAFERRSEAEAVARLKARRVSHPERVAAGIEGVLRGLNRGDLQALYLMQTFTARGWLCDACSVLGAFPLPPACTECGATISACALEDHVVDRAAALGATLETVLDSEALEDLGGIAAQLHGGSSG